jgi:hypothetical protein
MNYFKGILLTLSLCIGINPVHARKSGPKRSQRAHVQVKQYKSPLQQLLHQNYNFCILENNVRLSVKQFNAADCDYYLKTSRILKQGVPLHINIVNNSPYIWIFEENGLSLPLVTAEQMQHIIDKKSWGSFFKGVFLRMGFSFAAYPVTYFMGSIFWGGSKDAITFGDCAKAGLLAAPWAIVKEGFTTIADNYQIRKDIKSISVATKWEIHPYTTANILLFANPQEFTKDFNLNLTDKLHTSEDMLFNVKLA